MTSAVSTKNSDLLLCLDPPGNLNVRTEVVPADASAIEQLVRDTKYFAEYEIPVARELVEDRLQDGAASGYEFVILEDNQRVVGYSCFGAIACTKNAFDLYWIAVHPDFQRLGLGLWLAKKTELEIRQRGGLGVYIETSGREQYASTRRFYERCGYAVVAEFPDFYDLGDPKIVYVKRLSQ